MTRSSKSKTAPKRLLIVDDHPMTRDGLKHLIDREPDLVVSWEAENAAQALQTVVKVQPDLALVDITLPDKSGIDLIKDLKAVRPDLPVLVISMHDESLYAERALRAGARGYVTKQEGGAKLMQAIRQVLSGQIYVDGKTAARIVEIFSGQRSSGQDRSPVALLSDREFEIFQLIGEGLASKEIGARMNISAKTVEAHRLNIKSKLGLNTAAELIAFGARWTASQSGGGGPPAR
jgi:DNA-binding NarL/FixJ family response regulator